MTANYPLLTFSSEALATQARSEIVRREENQAFKKNNGDRNRRQMLWGERNLRAEMTRFTFLFKCATAVCLDKRLGKVGPRQLRLVAWKKASRESDFTSTLTQYLSLHLVRR